MISGRVSGFVEGWLTRLPADIQWVFVTATVSEASCLISGFFWFLACKGVCTVLLWTD